MTQNTRDQSPRKESQESANNRRDERKDLPSPDMDFPEDSPNPGPKTT